MDRSSGDALFWLLFAPSRPVLALGLPPCDRQLHKSPRLATSDRIPRHSLLYYDYYPTRAYTNIFMEQLINRRWNVYRPTPGQYPLDSLNSWEGLGLAKSRVEWEDHSTQVSGISVHTSIPLVSCRRYYVVASNMMSRFRRVCSPRDNPRIVAEQLIFEWLHDRREFMVEYDFTGQYDNYGQYVVWVTRFISKLERLPVQSCQGQGRTITEARHEAARLLLESGLCMICLR